MYFTVKSYTLLCAERDSTPIMVIIQKKIRFIIYIVFMSK